MLLRNAIIKLDCEIEVVNQTTEDKEDLMQDLISIITSFCARYYGLRRSKRKTEKVIKELQDYSLSTRGQLLHCKVLVST